MDPCRRSRGGEGDDELNIVEEIDGIKHEMLWQKNLSKNMADVKKGSILQYEIFLCRSWVF